MPVTTSLPCALRAWMTALAATALLAACGGGSSDDDVTPSPTPSPSPAPAPTPAPAPANVTRVQVVGDSLSDSGVMQGVPTYGRGFTIQGSASEPDTMWTERIAKAYGLSSLCPVYRFDGAHIGANPTAGCTSYAVGGARINNSLQPGGQLSPQAIERQLKDAQARGFVAGDLVLVDGGGNDTADLAETMLLSPMAVSSDMRAILKALLSDTEIDATFTRGGMEALGELYMTRLADRFYDQVNDHVLVGSEARVGVLNVPDVTKTPLFLTALAQVEAVMGAAARAQLSGHVSEWVDAFNEQLDRRAEGNRRVVIADFEDMLNDVVANPARFGVSNVTEPACQPGFGGLNLNFELCTAAALSAVVPPAGVSGGSNWWQTYLFSDSFHPTPYGHELMANMVWEKLGQAGWQPIR